MKYDVVVFVYITKYTERQMKLITSSERRSLKSTASKLIIFRHRSYGSAYEAHLKN